MRQERPQTIQPQADIITEMRVNFEQLVFKRGQIDVWEQLIATAQAEVQRLKRGIIERTERY